MAMKKSAKIGLGIFIGFVSVIVIIVAAAAIILFGGRGFTPYEVTAEDKQAVVEQMPVIDKLEQIKGDAPNSNIVYSDPQPGEVALDEGQLNALVSANNPAQNLFDGSNSQTQYELPEIKIDGTSVKIEDDQLELKMKLGQSSVTNNAVVDDFLSGSVATGKFETVDGKAVLTEFQLNNLGADMIPEFILNELPDYNGGSMVDYINQNYPDAIQAAFENLFAAERIDSITIKDSQIKVEGSFYQDASVEE